jgi:hypothetical protein
MDIQLAPTPAPSDSLHLLPCGINHDGRAKVSSYFHVSTTELGSVASFRGRKLTGAQIRVPDTYHGVVYRETSRPTEDVDGDGDERYWRPVAGFNHFTLFDHDYAPADTDPFRRIVDWIALAEAVIDAI